jgi:hypothetical protein
MASNRKRGRGSSRTVVTAEEEDVRREMVVNSGKVRILKQHLTHLNVASQFVWRN